MWLYLIEEKRMFSQANLKPLLIKTSQRNDLSGTIHSAGYEFCRAAALHRPASVEKLTAIHAAKFPVTCLWRL